LSINMQGLLSAELDLTINGKEFNRKQVSTITFYRVMYVVCSYRNLKTIYHCPDIDTPRQYK